jgi:hypothetical protein
MPHSPLQDLPDAALAGSEEPSAPASVLRPLSLGAPLQWLRLGWQDFTHAPAIGLFYGLCFMVMGWALLAVFEFSPAYVLALSGGFLLMGPVLVPGHVPREPAA